MATPSRIGTFTIAVDGEWDIEDLRDVAEGLSETYGLLYPLVAEDDEVRDRLQDSLRQTFWSGNVESRFIGERLYRQIPFDESLRLKSFQYSSQGAMTIVGVLSALWLMARVTNAWIKTGDAFVDLWAKIEKFFAKRPHFQRTKKQFELDHDIAVDVDEARELVFDMGNMLGFSHTSCEVLISTVGNPFSALKFLVAVAKEGRKMAQLQNEGKLKLPPPNSEQIELKPSAVTKRRMQGGVPVERKGRRKKPPK